jgi:hypothetical protein
MTDLKAPAPWTMSEMSAVLTYIYPFPAPWQPCYQLQWDYQIDSRRRGLPTITLLLFNSYQPNTAHGKAELVEKVTEMFW